MVWKNAVKVTKLNEGKTKMIRLGTTMVMVGLHQGEYFATEALCRHMRWPLAYGGKVRDGCIRCPLHQTTHQLEDGSLVEWAPFPLFPPYGRFVGKLSKQKDLKIYQTRIQDGMLQVDC